MTYFELKEVFNNTQTQEKITYLLLFLMPIAGPVVRHWNSYIFVLFFLSSIYFLFTKKDKKPLLKEEKVILSAFGLFFISYLISAILNGWTEPQTRELGLELMFLWFIPVYFLIREYEFSLNAFFSGILLSIPIIFLFSLYEYYYVSTPVLIGAYSQLFLGPITALLLLFYVDAYKFIFGKKHVLWVLPIIYVLGLSVIILTFSRSAYLTLIIGIILYVMLFIVKLKHKIIFSALTVIILSGFMSVEKVKDRVTSAYNNVESYINEKNINSRKINTSLGLRLEMWRSAQYAVTTHPFFGIGAANHPGFIKKYIKEGKVNSGVGNHSHLHNSFVEVISSKGIVGLFILLILFYYPVYIAWKNRERCIKCYMYAVILSVTLTAMSIGESMLINKNNAVTYFIFFSAVLFSFTMRMLYPNNFKSI
jgi:O-antigen ligase